MCNSSDIVLQSTGSPTLLRSTIPGIYYQLSPTLLVVSIISPTLLYDLAMYELTHIGYNSPSTVRSIIDAGQLLV